VRKIVLFRNHPRSDCADVREIDARFLLNRKPTNALRHADTHFLLCALFRRVGDHDVVRSPSGPHTLSLSDKRFDDSMRENPEDLTVYKIAYSGENEKPEGSDK
jgi:hypothetical protein